MSMILDALTRAEHERHLEKQPDLKFVTPVKPQKQSPNKIWGWVAFGLLANAFLLFFIIRAISGDTDDETQVVVDSETIIQKNQRQEKNALQSPVVVASKPQPIVQEQAPLANADSQVVQPEVIQQEPIQAIATENDRTLAMEANNVQTPEVDRPLFYESKQANLKSNVAKPKLPAGTANASASVNKGNVSFSSTELTSDDAAPVAGKPKLLIDQGQDKVASSQLSSSGVPSLRDLPESSRSNLSQYEVNVHVFDDEPIRRFVLINMDKYKEGDRIVDNGPLIEEITPAGVVVDYGNGRALLPPK